MDVIVIISDTLESDILAGLSTAASCQAQVVSTIHSETMWNGPCLPRRSSEAITLKSVHLNLVGQMVDPRNSILVMLIQEQA